MKPCPFCERIDSGDVTLDNDLAVAFPDGFPISPGHTLIVPKRHEADFFALSVDEQEAILALTRIMRDRLDRELHPSAFNIGVNVGADAGQTVGHVHLHLIPRFSGDVEDPRGGIRWMIPDKAIYWEGD